VPTASWLEANNDKDRIVIMCSRVEKTKYTCLWSDQTVQDTFNEEISFDPACWEKI